MTDTFTAQASALVNENRRLRIKSDGDDKTITTIKQQYDVLARDFETYQHRCGEREHALITERDQAVREKSEIEGLLNQAADLIIQALQKSRPTEDGESPIRYKAAPIPFHFSTAAKP